MRQLRNQGSAVQSYSLPYVFRQNPRAKRLSLRVDPHNQRLVVTVPHGTSQQRLQDFLSQTEGWSRSRLAKLLPSLPLKDGTVVTILGEEITLRSVPESRKRLWVEDNTVWIGGHPDNIPIRVKAWIIKTLKNYVEKRSIEFATTLNKRIKEIRVRDLKSRWGSCSSEGVLCYTWRLAFASLDIIDYVCAHEVAHLVEMNHSPRFWKIVHQLCPNALHHRHWLKKQGAQLLRYG
jgi:predicted metal-dependent hydrolase